MLEAGRHNEESMKDKNETYTNKPAGYMASRYNKMNNFLSKHQKIWKVLFLITLNLVIVIYLVFATLYWEKYNYENGCDWCDGYGMLILLFAFGYGGVLYYYAIRRFFRRTLSSCIQPLREHIQSFQRRRRSCGTVLKALLYICIFAAIIVFLVFDTASSRERLVSAIGVVVLLGFGWVFSKHPGNVKWRPVLTGLILQFLFGLLTIRWPVGRAIFECISNKVATFLEFAKKGSSFIFSNNLVEEGVFAFSALPVIFYFSFIIEILYYLGVMQAVILNIGGFLQTLMGTTICESVNCAGNIFIGMTESPLLIKPYLNKLTGSELHAIMCSGFATVSGTVLAAYIGFGANPANLVTATLMAAPAALCYSKLFYPETEKPMLTTEDIVLERSKDSNILDAACKGATAAIPIVLSIVANIVAFISFIALLNALLGWIGILVGFNDLSFEYILSKVFMPVSWIIGVPWSQCEDVGTLIGLKTVVNEFVAYQKLGELKSQGRIWGRSEAIATFAICGFGNPSSIGITLSVMSSLASEKKKEITGAVGRAFVAGCAVCLLTASVAGLLITDDAFGNITNTMAVVNASIATTAATIIS
ncbi:concentrative nucleoside transporter 2 isoform X2 [Calliopsis andreniformis]